MLPSFENLIESKLNANVSKVHAAGFTEPEAGVRSLMRIRSLWRDSIAANPEKRSSLKEEPAWYWHLQRVCQDAPLKY